MGFSRQGYWSGLLFSSPVDSFWNLDECQKYSTEWEKQCSVQFSHSVMSDTLRPHGLQYARFPFPSPAPGAYSNSCLSSQWSPSNHLILCHPLLLPSIFPSIRVFSNESVLHIRWPKYWSFSFNISPSDDSSWLIYFRMDWLDLLVVQGTFKSLLQHHSSKASIHWHSAFFMVLLSHLYMTTGKNVAFTLTYGMSNLSLYIPCYI